MGLLTNFSIETEWDKVLAKEYNAPYFLNLAEFVMQERLSGKNIYPEPPLVFNALKTTPYNKVKAVIIGQDPYHGPGQAHGLSFSVRHGIKPPPSLVNIFKELHADIGITIPMHGCLEKWAEQGILLLNSTLTVEQEKPLSHHGRGWEQFTDAVVQSLVKHPESIVFILWGRKAIEKAGFLKETHHHILTSSHPSPFSAYSGFFGCKHFSKTNELLIKQNKQTIDWSL